MAREILLFEAALLRAQERGFVNDVKKVTEGVFSGRISAKIPSVTLGRIMAANLPGQGYPLKSGGGLNWTVGTRHYGTLLHPSTIPDIRLSQSIVQSVVGEGYEERWTFGALARQLLRYVRPGKQEEGYTGDAERLLLGTPYGYSECVPGLHQDVVYYDVSAYYYNMLKRLPSLNVYCGRKELVWQDTDAGEWERWKQVIHNVGEVKPLRNVLAGNMAGATPSDEGLVPLRVYWSNKTGKVRVDPIPHSWGRFRAVGLLLVRSGAELLMRTCHAAEDGVVYANVDAVHLTNGLPSIWGDYGFAVRVKAEGPEDTCHRGSYFCGYRGDNGEYIGAATEPYKQGQRMRIPEGRLPLPPVQFASWLAG